MERGYTEYPPQSFDSYSTVSNFQKRFDDESGKKYFIDVHKCSNDFMSDYDKQQDWYNQYSYEYSCQLYKKGSHAPLNMLFFSDWNLEDVENFVESLFATGQLDYYERRED